MGPRWLPVRVRWTRARTEWGGGCGRKAERAHRQARGVSGGHPRKRMGALCRQVGAKGQRGRGVSEAQATMPKSGTRRAERGGRQGASGRGRWAERWSGPKGQVRGEKKGFSHFRFLF